MSCLVIGAGPGMGEAIATRFAKGSLAVGLVARRGEQAEAIAEKLRAGGGNARGYAADAANEEQLKQTIARAASDLGAISVLVYNAAAVSPGEPSKLSARTLLADLQVNVAGALVAAQTVIPAMKAAGMGTILLTGGGFAFEPMPSLASLGIGKAAIRNLAFSLFKELEPAGIHAATVTIGGIVKPGTAFDPAVIAEEFWKLHQQPAGQFQRETVFRPS